MEQPPSILKSPLPKHFSAQSHLGLASCCLLLHKTCLLQAEIQKLLIQSITWTILAHPYPGFFFRFSSVKSSPSERNRMKRFCSFPQTAVCFPRLISYPSACKSFRSSSKICRFLIQAFQNIFPDDIPHAHTFRVLCSPLPLTRLYLWNNRKSMLQTDNVTKSLQYYSGKPEIPELPVTLQIGGIENDVVMNMCPVHMSCNNKCVLFLFVNLMPVSYPTSFASSGVFLPA